MSQPTVVGTQKLGFIQHFQKKTFVRRLNLGHKNGMPTVLYLLRHAEAAPGIPDEARPLTPRGHQQVAALVDFIKHNTSFQPETIWHSHLLRAQETATIFAKGIHFKGRVEALAGIAPNDPAEHLVRRLHTVAKSAVIVGHNPFLERLATGLLQSHSDIPVCHMRKASLLALEREDTVGAQWQLSWFIFPGILQKD